MMGVARKEGGGGNGNFGVEDHLTQNCRSELDLPQWWL